MSTVVQRNRWTAARVVRRLPWWGAALVIGIGGLLWIYPFLWMIGASLKDPLEVFTSGLSLIPKHTQWGNYGRAWSDAGFGQYLFNTVVVTVTTVVLVVLRCAMAGYVLARHHFFGRIMMPLANPVTATVTLLTFLGTWNAFFLPLVFSFSRPDLRTLSVGMLAFVGENSTDWSGMAAAATISLLPVVALFVVLQRYFVEGIAGAVKS